MELDKMSCSPCLDGVPPLGPSEVIDFAGQVPAWELRDDSTRIVREFKFESYAQALAFVNAISAIAEAEGHHPDIHFGWGYATVSLQTHKIKGLHEQDFIMAAKFDRAVVGLADAARSQMSTTAGNLAPAIKATRNAADAPHPYDDCYNCTEQH